MNPVYIGVLEAGRSMPSPDTLFELADAFKFDTE